MNKMVSTLGMMAVGLVLMTLGACGGGAEEPVLPAEADAVVAGLSAADSERAVALFQEEACTICHGEMAEGMGGAGPALQGLAPYWNVNRLVVYLESPEAFREANPDFEHRRDQQFDFEMPAFDHLSEEQRQLLAGWLMAR